MRASTTGGSRTRSASVPPERTLRRSTTSDVMSYGKVAGDCCRSRRSLSRRSRGQPVASSDANAGDTLRAQRRPQHRLPGRGRRTDRPRLCPRMDLHQLAPSEDEAFKRRLATYFRRSASPGAAVALLRMNTQIDVRDVLPTIQAPTLVMQRTDDRDVKVEEGRWIAAQIPGAEYVELPGDSHTLWAGNTDEIVDEIEEFLTGARVASVAAPGEVLVSSTVKDLVAGSGIVFEDRGEQQLKGLPDAWHL